MVGIQHDGRRQWAKKMRPTLVWAAMGVSACCGLFSAAFAVEPLRPTSQHRSIALGHSPLRHTCTSGAWCAAAVGASTIVAASFVFAQTTTKLARSRLQRTPRADALMPWKIPNTSRWQWLSVRELLLRERILMLTEFIDEQYSNAIIAMLLYLQSEDASKPIQIYFSVPGAALKPALSVYDTICQLKNKGCKLTTVGYSLCSGMGAFLAASGTKGRRFATPNALFRLSRVGLESPMRGQASDIALEAMQILKESKQAETLLAEVTGRTPEQIDQDLKRDFYLSPDQAVEFGLVDRVLVPDVDKGEKLDKGVRDPWSGTLQKEKVGFGVFADPNQPRTAV
eukprot:CAMPEP_0172680392 /NCGR_PEP_ID=MMETSP1074-20121228/16737_1 /TAXON_ID=2916 /ORGANISM="Ceratium fusus, Strain PA161109" /LENGTH=339 /DNA_ID=CAMNT_0013498715 /DNA_START=1 /DNA_END=1020 /DNA_ORIENTATION=+